MSLYFSIKAEWFNIRFIVLLLTPTPLHFAFLPSHSPWHVVPRVSVLKHFTFSILLRLDGSTAGVDLQRQLCLLSPHLLHFSLTSSPFVDLTALACLGNFDGCVTSRVQEETMLMWQLAAHQVQCESQGQTSWEEASRADMSALLPGMGKAAPELSPCLLSVPCLQAAPHPEKLVYFPGLKLSTKIN